MNEELKEEEDDDNDSREPPILPIKTTTTKSAGAAPRGDPPGRNFQWNQSIPDDEFPNNDRRRNKNQEERDSKEDQNIGQDGTATKNGNNGGSNNRGGVLSSLFGSSWFRMQQQRRINNLKRQKSQREKEYGAEFLRLKQQQQHQNNTTENIGSNDDICNDYLEKVQKELQILDDEIQQCYDSLHHHQQQQQQNSEQRPTTTTTATNGKHNKKQQNRSSNQLSRNHHRHHRRRGRSPEKNRKHRRRNDHDNNNYNQKVRPSKRRSPQKSNHHHHDTSRRGRSNDRRKNQPSHNHRNHHHHHHIERKSRSRSKSKEKTTSKDDHRIRRSRSHSPFIISPTRQKEQSIPADHPAIKEPRKNAPDPHHHHHHQSFPIEGYEPTDTLDDGLVGKNSITKPPSIIERRPQNQKLPKRISVQQQRRRLRLSSSMLNNESSHTPKLFSDINLSKTPEAFKDGPHIEKWTNSQFTLQTFQSRQYGYVSTTLGEVDLIVGKSIKDGIAKFKAHPKLFIAMIFPNELMKYPIDQQQYTLIYRNGTTGIKPKDVIAGRKTGKVTFMTYGYQPIPSFPSQDKYGLPAKYRDRYTDNMVYERRKAVCQLRPPFLPGRGMGLLDNPTLKLIGEVDPGDIAQGQIGDCWLLSGISCFAEYDGAVERLFRRTKDFDQMPFADGRPNLYTITLWDLRTWTEVDIVVDERIPRRSDGRGIFLGAKPSKDGELWVCYLEKAIAAHCGGYDQINGGQCTHAWSLLTGRKEQFIIQKDKDDPKRRFGIYAKYNIYTKRWSDHENCPADGNLSVWRVPWPAVGGGGRHNLDDDGLFLQMCTWDDHNYLIGAGTKGVSDRFSTNGIVDNHAYSILDCRNDVAGTGVDLIRVRNPWGHGEISRGAFNKGGPGWTKYPQIKIELGYDESLDDGDDGVFWMTKQEFFRHFETVYLGATDMSTFIRR